MKEFYPEIVQKLVSSLLEGPAETEQGLRKSIEAFSASLGGGRREVGEIPGELRDYVTKVSLYAYKVTDEDIQRLKSAGYSEDEIYEITLCAALGAGLARYERGMSILGGVK